MLKVYDCVGGIKGTVTKLAKPSSKKEVTELEDSEAPENVVKTSSKTTIGRRRRRPSKLSLTNDNITDTSVMVLESPTKKIKLDKKLSLSFSKKKAEPIVKVPKAAILSTIDDVDSEESLFFAPVTKLSKGKAKNPEPQEGLSQIEAEPKVVI